MSVVREKSVLLARPWNQDENQNDQHGTPDNLLHLHRPHCPTRYHNRLNIHHGQLCTSSFKPRTLRPFPGTALATTRPISSFRTTLIARIQSRRRFPSPDLGALHEARHNIMDAQSFGIFLAAFTPHGPLAATSDFAHGRQFPTT